MEQVQICVSRETLFIGYIISLVALNKTALLIVSLFRNLPGERWNTWPPPFGHGHPDKHVTWQR